MIAFKMNGASLARIGALLVLALAGSAAMAQDNAIESITANQQGSNVVVNIVMKNAPAKLPIGFSITNPSRIASTSAPPRMPPARIRRTSTSATCGRLTSCRPASAPAWCSTSSAR
jgi:hypothetical protein